MPAAVALACVAEVPEAAPVVAAVVACQLALVVAASVAAWLQVAPVAASVAACQLGPGLVAAAAAGSKSRCCFALALAKQLLQVAKKSTTSLAGFGCRNIYVATHLPINQGTGPPPVDPLITDSSSFSTRAGTAKLCGAGPLGMEE